MKLGRKTFAPSTKPKFIRQLVSTKESLPSPVKKSRMEVYQERKVQKPVHKVVEPKRANPVKVIEKAAQFYGAAAEKPLPQRKVVPRKPVPEQQYSKPVDYTYTKPAEKETRQEAKEAPVVKKVNAEKESEISPEDTKPYVKPNEDGQYELSSAISSILHDELQHIMIKVWQELPDAPHNDAERLVANKFRNEAGDDLQNAMGLSVTSRLLNVHNPLYVKLHFSGKPEAGRLQAFIREYKITAFKRIGDSFRDTFAARFDRIVDFDRFCVQDQVKCGSATVTITPCYKYLSCPPSIKTIYADNIAKTKTEASTNSSLQKQADTDKEKIESTEVKTGTKEVITKVNSETEKSATQANTANNKTATTVIAKEAVKAVPKVNATEKPYETKNTKEAPTEVKRVTPKMVENKNDVINITKVIEVPEELKKSENKIKDTKEAPTEVKNVSPKKVHNKNEVKEVPTELNKVTPIKVENKNAMVNKNTVKEVPAELKKVENKSEVVKENEVPTELKKVTPKKKAIKNEAVNNDVVDKIKELDVDVIDDMMVVDEMGEEDDDEEMTDRDILALISGGIVLDECSGSDDEK